ncbi:PREDICTED: dynein light chain Tctex-type 1-like [Cyprinodon variegatus]|uniref:dynein light chain Tctex-type 1-like n=1 Tax=Cyprinodon variegatus TaxID=28743 RepID=UPI000742ACC0|nr:PREDICTED: dynein light chain Tctex-type 1-like [Cyprinodon variegatus]
MEEYQNGSEGSFNSEEAEVIVKEVKLKTLCVTCSVMQKTGAGLHTANSCYWDTSMDGSCTVRWENRTMYCVVSVFAVSIA